MESVYFLYHRLHCGAHVDGDVMGNSTDSDGKAGIVV